MEKTAIQNMMDIIEMEHNNGVQVSTKVFYLMLKEALQKERKQIRKAYCEAKYEVFGMDDKNEITKEATEYYNRTYKNK